MKHIKKSMFISTVLMVVMLIAALSTATFAWYTSNNTVSSTAITAGAAQSDDANIGIGWYKGARDATITFHNLVNGDDGDMAPVAPITYYNKVGDTANPGDAYLTSIEAGASAGTYIAEAFAPASESNGLGVDYLRVVNLTTTDVSSLVKAKSAYQHNPASGKATNWNEAKVNELAANYSVVYTTTKYAYNNSNDYKVPTSGAAPVSTSSKVAVDTFQYTVVASPSTDTPCYEVTAVYEIAADGASSLTGETGANTTGKVHPTYAFDLVNGGGQYTPQAGYYLVAYKVYNYASYTDYSKYASNTDYTVEGYIGNAAAALNTNDISKSVLEPTYGLKGNMKYDKDGFCYLYQIYKSNTAIATLTRSKDSYAGFAFAQANIDSTGYFKGAGAAATVAQFWTGNADPTPEYKGSGKHVAVLTGTTTASSKATMNSFFVTNNGSTTTTSALKISISAMGDNAANLRVAVFARTDPTDANPEFTYYGTLADDDDAKTTFGSILKGANKDNMPTYLASSEIELIQLGAGAENALEIQLIAWFDGTGLDDTKAGQKCSFTVTIKQ